MISVLRLFVFMAVLGVASTATAKPLLPVDHWEQDGIPIYRVHADTLPMSRVMLVFRAGAAYAPKPGLAALTASLLNQGSVHLTADQFANQLGDQGILFDADADLTSAWVSVQARTVAWDDATRLLLEALQPRFAVSAVDQRQQQLARQLQMLQQSPAYHASLSFRQHLFPKGALHQALLGETPASIMTLGSDDVAHFYQQYYTASNVSLLIVGDVTHQQADALAKRVGKVLPAGHLVKRPGGVVDERSARARVSIPFKSRQSHVVVGQVLPSLHEGDPDYWALMVANDILGGSGLSSQLFEAVRNKAGLAYSVSSRLGSVSDHMVWQMRLQTRHDQLHQALDVMLNTAESLIADGPTEAEVLAAKKHLLGALPLQFDSDAKRMQGLSFLVLHHLPLDRFDRQAAQLAKINVRAVQAAMHKHWQPQQWLVVAVGPEVPAHG